MEENLQPENHHIHTRILPFKMPALALRTSLFILLSFFSFSVTAEASWKSVKAAIIAAAKAGDEDKCLDALELLKKETHDNEGVVNTLMRYCVISESQLVHELATEILLKQKSGDAQLAIANALAKSKNWEQRAVAAMVCGLQGTEYGYGKLIEALKDKKWQVRSAAIQGLAKYRRKASIDLFIAMMKKETGRVQFDLVTQLQLLTGQTIGNRDERWKSWWKNVASRFEVPTLAEAQKLVDPDGNDQKQSLGTAVRKGLYGSIRSEKIAFLVDVSGSMLAGTDTKGDRLEIAQHELTKVINRQLSKKTYFNIISFAEEVQQFKRKLQKAKPGTIKKAAAFVDQLEAGGETNAYGALLAAFSDPTVDTIYLLSDGSPTAGDETIPSIILRKIKKLNRHRKVIINCIGFFPGDAKHEDKESARDFLRRLAHENDGFYREIY